jgi:hypothetical protein
MWAGKFDRDSIESLTKKTGSAKKYSVFIKMLHSALDQSSESVIVDVLTPRDLELLRDRRQRESQIQGGDTTAQGKLDDSKMFLILTYICEFEKIHYPLSLSKSVPKEQQLLQTINALRQELAATKSHSTANNSLMLGSLAPLTAGNVADTSCSHHNQHKPSLGRTQGQQQQGVGVESISWPLSGIVVRGVQGVEQEEVSRLKGELASQYERHKEELGALFLKLDKQGQRIEEQSRTIAAQQERDRGVDSRGEDAGEES